MNHTVTVELTGYTYGREYNPELHACPNLHGVGPSRLAEYRVLADGHAVLSCAGCLPGTIQFAARGRTEVLT